MNNGWYDVCPFLKGNECIIYNVRPLICRAYTCSKFKNKDFTGLDLILKGNAKLINIRKDIFDGGIWND